MKTEKQCYETLGLNVGATEEEVKSAYRELAKKNHPDINNSPEAKERFIAIQEAYESIINQKFAMEIPPVGGPEDFFSQFGGFTFGPFANSIVNGPKTQPRVFSLSISFLEACLGATKTISYNYQTQCSDCAEHLKQHGKINIFTCRSCSGAGFIKKTMGPISISQPCMSCGGVGMMLKCDKCNGTGSTPDSKQVRFKIEPGIEDGSAIRITAQGDFNYKLNSYGDIIIKISVLPHPEMTRNGMDIFSRLKVNYLDCILGADVDFDSIHGKDTVKVPPLTQAGSIIKKASAGIKQIGDHVLTIDIQMPESIGPIEKKLLNKLRNSKSKN